MSFTDDHLRHTFGILLGRPVASYDPDSEYATWPPTGPLRSAP